MDLKIKHKPTVDLEPVSYTQVKDAGDGDWVVIEQDVGDIVKQLNELDSSIRVQWNKRRNFYAMYVKEGNTERLVRTFQELDYRIVERVREILDPGYNFQKEEEADEKKRNKEFEHKWDEKVGEKSEELAYVLQRALGLNKNKAYF